MSTPYDYAVFNDSTVASPGAPLDYNEASIPIEWGVSSGPTQTTPFAITVEQRDEWWNRFDVLACQIDIVESFKPSGVTYNLSLPRRLKRQVVGTPNTRASEADLYLPGIGTDLIGPTEFYAVSGTPGPDAAVVSVRLGFFAHINPLVAETKGLFLEAGAFWRPKITLDAFVQYYDGTGAPDYGYNFSNDYDITGNPGPVADHGELTFCPAQGGGTCPITMFLAPPLGPPDFSVNVTIVPETWFSWDGLWNTLTGEPN